MGKANGFSRFISGAFQKAEEKRQRERASRETFNALDSAIRTQDVTAFNKALVSGVAMNDGQAEQLVKTAIWTDNPTVVNATVAGLLQDNLNYQVSEEAGECYTRYYSLLGYAICAGRTNVAQSLADNKAVDAARGTKVWDDDSDCLYSSSTPRELAAQHGMPGVEASLIERDIEKMTRTVEILKVKSQGLKSLAKVMSV